MITIKECLEIMHRGEVFSIEYVTYDRKRKYKSGEVVAHDAAQLIWGGHSAPAAKHKGKSVKKSEHQIHYTRNIRLFVNGLPTESIVKIHPPLIRKFNGQTTCP